jgi:phosphoesterase RecJ-like protein
VESGLQNQIDVTLVERAMTLILSARTVALLAHEHPDGDCIGSALGMAFMLRELGKTCSVVCADPPPGNLSFLPGFDEVEQTLGDEQFDLVIALDAGELPRFGSVYTRHRAFLDQAAILNFDHHISSDGCGQVNIIDPKAAATAELLVLFQQQAGLPMNYEAALCLLAGIITDTSSFQFTNTTPRTLEVAAQLMRHGVIPETVVQPVYRTRPLGQARLQALVIARAQTDCGGRLIWSHATDETLREAGATPDMDDNLSGMLRDIEGVQVAAFFKNYGNPLVTRLSLRCAAPYNAAEFCQRYDGGGHARAAGATINLPINEAIELVVSDLRRMMSEG